MLIFFFCGENPILLRNLGIDDSTREGKWSVLQSADRIWSPLSHEPQPPSPLSTTSMRNHWLVFRCSLYFLCLCRKKMRAESIYPAGRVGFVNGFHALWGVTYGFICTLHSIAGKQGIITYSISEQKFMGGLDSLCRNILLFFFSFVSMTLQQPPSHTQTLTRGKYFVVERTWCWRNCVEARREVKKKMNNKDLFLQTLFTHWLVERNTPLPPMYPL